jgi:alanyl-tRNA synthetase
VSSNFDAAMLIREVASVAGGSGGGRPELARAGGGDPARLDAALQRAAEVVQAARSGSS